LTPIP